MSEIVEIVETLESRIQKLFHKMEGLEKTSESATQELKQARMVIQKQSDAMEALKNQYDILKISSSLLGSEENKKDTKLKINSLIRDIDYCIAQLSD